MGQTWTDDVFAGTHNAQTDLQNMENNFQTLKTMFSGISAPANAVEGMGWFDSDNFVMKQYNNTAWQGLMHGDLLQKMYVYRNTAMAGWVVDTSVSDRVLAFKGGGTYTTGGAAAGSFTHGHTDTFAGAAHNHKWYDYVSLDTYDTYNSAGSAITLEPAFTGPGSIPVMRISSTDYYTNNATPAVTGSVTSNTTLRPAASVGTLQRLNL